MVTLAACLFLVREARAAGEDPASAYVVRTRLERVLVAIASCVPALPPEPAAGGEDVGLIADCSHLRAAVGSLCQPSEALDARWREGWQAVSEILVRMQDRLEKLSPA